MSPDAIAAAVRRQHPTRTASAVELEILTLAHRRAVELGIESRFEVALDDVEISRTRRLFVAEVVGEPNEDRARMLTFAASEGSLGDRPPSETATVARILRDLTAADARELKRIASTTADGAMLLGFHGYADGPALAHGTARHQAWEASPSRDALEILGLVRVARDWKVGLPLFISARGELVLSLLRAWA